MSFIQQPGHSGQRMLLTAAITSSSFPRTSGLLWDSDTLQALLVFVIASEAKQSRLGIDVPGRDCFASLAMT